MRRQKKKDIKDSDKILTEKERKRKRDKGREMI